jgi:hypothetical protein
MMRKLSPLTEVEEGEAARVVDFFPFVNNFSSSLSSHSGIGGFPSARVKALEHNLCADADADADAGVERVEMDLDDEDDKEMGRMQGVKHVDIEVTDDESEAGDDGDSAVGGIKRKRTIRVVIRSRAFL